MNVTHIHSATARDAYRALLTALGSENVPDQWMQFMEAVETYLPVMAGAGRPMKSDIEQSLIGQLGFSSWAEMVETPVENGGLGWSINSWKLWVKAWKLVKAHSYLRESGYTASMIMKLSGQFEQFPGDAETLSQAIAENKQKAKATGEQKLADLQGKITELERQLMEARLRLESQQSQVRDSNELQVRLADTELEKRSIQQRYDAMAEKVTELAQANQRLQSELLAKSAPQQAGIWKKIRSLFGG